MSSTVFNLAVMDDGSTQGSGAGPQVLDDAVLASLAEQLGEDIDGLVARFAKRLAETTPAVARSLAAGDQLELTRQAHSLKSVAATFGASAVARSSAALEACAGGDDRAEVTAAVERLASDCEAAHAAVTEWLSSRGS